MADVLQNRIAELQSMKWWDIRSAAEDVGFDGKPDEELSWEDNAPAIAQRELDSGLLDTPEPITEPEPVTQHVVLPQPSPSTVLIGESLPPNVRGVYNTALYKARGIPTCPVCGEKELTNSQGKPCCPEGFAADQCPRLED